ncbi:MAG: hypothetical protein CL885_02690 [Dehalococcoidia bacterium]|nr:hypothetical protein [Dehalococcoidia bacterium]
MKISKFKDVDTYEDILHKDTVEKELKNIQDQSAAEHSENKAILKNIKPRSERTKIFNQAINEDFIILETADELFNPPKTCKDIFDESSDLSEVNQFFILEEGVDPDRCKQRKFNFDTDTQFAIRLDQYSGDANGYFPLAGHTENNSSDIHLINDTLYKINIKIDEDPQNIKLEDGFTMSLNDIEKENQLSFKRDYTISGYTLNYIVESKANS